METLEVKCLEDWKAWLEQHAGSAREIWLVFNKAHAGGPAFSYDDAVCEALCVGWVDSLIRRLDDRQYARKFTPRRAGSQWSAVNRKRVHKLIEQGRMQPEGMAVVSFPLDQPVEPRPKSVDSPELALTQDLLMQLKASPQAYQNLVALAPSHRRNYLGWIMSAKRPETRDRRLLEAISMLEAGKPLGMK